MPAKKPTIGDVVLGRWVDSSSRITEWTYQEATLQQLPHESVGFLSHRDDQAINVCPHRLVGADGDEQHVGDLIIPRVRCCRLRRCVSVVSWPFAAAHEAWPAPGQKLQRS